MSRSNLILVVLIALQAVLGGVLWVRTRLRPASPAPDLSLLDPVDAAELKRAARHLGTARGWVREADCLMAYGYFPEAEACYRLASQQAPRDPEIRFQWAFILMLLGQSEQAVEQYKQALDNGHSDPAACQYFLGRNFLRQEQPDLAAGALKQAGGLPGAQYELAKLQWLQGFLPAAKEALGGLLITHPSSPRVNSLQARILADLDEPEYVTYMEFADRGSILLETPFDGQHGRLYELRRGFGLERKKVEVQEKLGALEPAPAAHLLREAIGYQWWGQGAVELASLEYQTGNVRSAEEVLGEVLSREGPSPQSLDMLGRVYLATGRSEKARVTLERAVWMGPTSYLSEIHQRLAELYSKLGDPNTSQWHAGMAYYGAGSRAYWEGNLDVAKQHLNKAVQLNSENPQAWFYLGETYRRSGEYSPATGAYENCLSLNPEHGRARRALAGIEQD